MERKYLEYIMRIAQKHLDEVAEKKNNRWSDRVIYEHILLTAQNRISIIRNPKAHLRLVVLRDRRLLYFSKKLKEKKDADSKILFDYVRQGIHDFHD